MHSRKWHFTTPHFIGWVVSQFHIWKETEKWATKVQNISEVWKIQKMFTAIEVPNGCVHRGSAMQRREQGSLPAPGLHFPCYAPYGGTAWIPRSPQVRLWPLRYGRPLTVPGSVGTELGGEEGEGV